MKTMLAALLGCGIVAVGVAPAADAAPRDGRTAYGCQVIYLGGQGYVFYRRGVTCHGAAKLAVKVYQSGGRAPRGYKCTSGSRFTSGANCQARNGSGRSFGWHPGD